MAIVFASNDAADFDVNMEEHTDATYFDSTMVSRGMRLECIAGGATPFGITLPQATAGDMWLHFRMSYPNANSNSDGVFSTFMDAAGMELAEFDLVNGNAAARVFGDSTQTGSYSALGAAGSMHTYDIKLSVGANITLEMYLGGALITSATAANTGGKGTPQHLRFDMDDFGQQNLAYYYFSEFIVADGESTIGMRLSELRPNTDGTYLDGAGTTASLADGDSATGVTLDAAGQKRSWNPTAYAGPASPTIHSVFSSATVRIGGGDITNARQFLRIGGTDYTGPDQSPNDYVGGVGANWAVNPATSLPWTEADLATFEAGIEARP